jgi:precorrin-4/cobalt-precorrin-4 C11-methyltransferase
VPEREQLAKIAAIGATTVIYLSVGMIERVVEELLRGAFTSETPVAVVAKATWPDEEILRGTLGDIAARVQAAGIAKQALIIVGDVLNARQQGLAALSRLYDREFSHGCREGIVV